MEEAQLVEKEASSEGCKAAFVALSALLALILKVARLTRALFRIVIRYYDSKRVAS